MTTNLVPRKRSRAVPASVPYEPWLIKQLKDPDHAAAYLEAVIEDGDQGAIMSALFTLPLAAEATLAVEAPAAARANAGPTDSGSRACAIECERLGAAGVTNTNGDDADR